MRGGGGGLMGRLGRLALFLFGMASMAYVIVLLYVFLWAQ